jgi:hypothetical protein
MAPEKPKWSFPKGLAKLIRGSVAEKVKEKATIEVKVFPPRELVATG